MKFTTEQAKYIVSNMNGLLRNEGMSGKMHLLINLVASQEFETPPPGFDKVLETLNNAPGELCERILQKVHAYWETDENGMPKADRPYPYVIENVEERLKIVGLL